MGQNTENLNFLYDFNNFKKNWVYSKLNSSKYFLKPYIDYIFFTVYPKWKANYNSINENRGYEFTVSLCPVNILIYEQHLTSDFLLLVLRCEWFSSPLSQLSRILKITSSVSTQIRTVDKILGE